MSDDITSVSPAQPAADTRRPDFADWIDGQQTPGMAIPAIAAPTLDLVERAFEAGRGAGMKARPLDDAASELLNEAGERLRHLAAQHSALVQAAVTEGGPNDDVARRVAMDAKHDRALANKIGRFLLQPVPGEQPTTGLLRRAFQAGSDYAKSVAEGEPAAEHDAIREARDDNEWAVQTGWTAAIAAVLGLVADMRRIWPNLIPPAVFLDRIGSLTPPEDLDEAFGAGRAIDARREALQEGLRTALGVIGHACDRPSGLEIMAAHRDTIAGLCALMGEDFAVIEPVAQPDAGDAPRVAALEGGLRQALAFIWLVQDCRDASAVLVDARVDQIDALGRLLDGDSYTRRKITPMTREDWLQDLERGGKEAARIRREDGGSDQASPAVGTAMWALGNFDNLSPIGKALANSGYEEVVVVNGGDGSQTLTAKAPGGGAVTWSLTDPKPIKPMGDPLNSGEAWTASILKAAGPFTGTKCWDQDPGFTRPPARSGAGLTLDANGVITGLFVNGKAQELKIYADAFRVVQPGEPPMPPSEVITTLDAAADGTPVVEQGEPADPADLAPRTLNAAFAADTFAIVGATGNSKPFSVPIDLGRVVTSKISLDIDAVPEVTIVDSEQRVVMTVKDGEVFMTDVGVNRLAFGALLDPVVTEALRTAYEGSADTLQSVAVARVRDDETAAPVTFNQGTPIADLKPGEPAVLALSVPDPKFDPGALLTVNGYEFAPAAKVRKAVEFTRGIADLTEEAINKMIEDHRLSRKVTGETAKIAWLILDDLQIKAGRAVPEYNQ